MTGIKEALLAVKEQEIVVVPLVLHGRLIRLMAEQGVKRGKSVKQLIAEAILEKADRMYKEDHPEEGG